MKKRWTKPAAAVCAAVMTGIIGITSFGAGPGEAAEEAVLENGEERVMFQGTVVSAEDGRLVMNRQQGDFFEEVVVTISEDTKVLESVNGYPVAVDHLTVGEPVRVYVGPAMTMSLPPIANGVLILTDVPADAGFPVYAKVESCVQTGESSDGVRGDYLLTTVDGESYQIGSDTTLLPYLTRNMVFVEDLTRGKDILLWPSADGSGAADKIVIFPSENRGESSGSGLGLETFSGEGFRQENGSWYYYQNGQRAVGWVLDQGLWYYMNPDTGVMETGFVTIDGKTYYLQENGSMLTEEAVFVPDADGVLERKK